MRVVAPIQHTPRHTHTCTNTHAHVGVSQATLASGEKIQVSKTKLGYAPYGAYFRTVKLARDEKEMSTHFTTISTPCHSIEFMASADVINPLYGKLRYMYIKTRTVSGGQ